MTERLHFHFPTYGTYTGRTQDWGDRLLKGTNRTSWAPGPRIKGAVTLQETESDLSVSVRAFQQRCESVVACCRVGGTDCSSAWDLLKEVIIIFITSP